MATQTPRKYVFNACNEYKGVRRYQCAKELSRDDLITSTINISKNRKFNNSIGVLYWLRLRQKNKWSKPVTGLKTTSEPLVYFGDISKITNGGFIPQHLLVFRFKTGGTQLIVEVYQNHYPKTEKGIHIYLK